VDRRSTPVLHAERRSFQPIGAGPAAAIGPLDTRSDIGACAGDNGRTRAKLTSFWSAEMLMYEDRLTRPGTAISRRPPTAARSTCGAQARAAGS